MNTSNLVESPVAEGAVDYGAPEPADDRATLLIRAAPDLLEFAREFVRVWAGPGATDSPLEAQARAAIAKAEGR